MHRSYADDDCTCHGQEREARQNYTSVTPASSLFPGNPKVTPVIFAPATDQSREA